MIAGNDSQPLNPRLEKAPRYFVTFRLFIVSMVTSDDNSIQLGFFLPNGIDDTLQCFFELEYLSMWNPHHKADAGR